ncbi:uncharacterized protein M6B38_396675 [Iris pallida]|uniref:Uncharacterized protein n=1 Tax=Iris pallida TaxID=29817 RepID=A0AAX6FVX6_IRIPA|nr:uncharacterized protein M6B38_396675 [Iris pallida]
MRGSSITALFSSTLGTPWECVSLLPNRGRKGSPSSAEVPSNALLPNPEGDPGGGSGRRNLSTRPTFDYNPNTSESRILPPPSAPQPDGRMVLFMPCLPTIDEEDCDDGVVIASLSYAQRTDSGEHVDFMGGESLTEDRDRRDANDFTDGDVFVPNFTVEANKSPSFTLQQHSLGEIPYL